MVGVGLRLLPGCTVLSPPPPLPRLCWIWQRQYLGGDELDAMELALLFQTDEALHLGIGVSKSTGSGVLAEHSLAFVNRPRC